jgi:nucleoside-diphosphate-sugar epimerase
MDKIIYITGASSKIGENLRLNLSESGHKVIVHNRTELKIHDNESFVKFTLEDGIKPMIGAYEHIIFHLAHDYYDRRSYKNSNTEGLKKIIYNFRHVTNKKIVFISTPDAENKKTTIYTAQKKISESLLDLSKDLIVRPSIIFSENELNNFFKYLPKIGVPIPVNNSKVAPMDVKKFSNELLSYSFNKDSIGIVLFSGLESISFKKFLKKQYEINTFNLHNSLWFILVFLFKITRIPKLFYLSERILGYIYLRDIETLHERDVKRKYI